MRLPSAVAIAVLLLSPHLIAQSQQEFPPPIEVDAQIREGRVSITERTPTKIGFEGSEPNPIPHAAGEGHEHTPCDQASIEVLGIRLQGRPGCRKFCIDLPQGHTPTKATAWARECTDNTWHTPCSESGGTCHVGWIRVERVEWYADKSRLCIAMKNWSHDRNRCFRGEVTFRAVDAVEELVKARPLFVRIHVVQPGENLSEIAAKYYKTQSWPRVYEANREIIRNPRRIWPGQELKIRDE